MRAVIQRVKQANVSVEGTVIGSIGTGCVILLGVKEGDTSAQAEKLWRKTISLRIFEDDGGKTNLSLADVGGSVLIVSQFTLYANCKRGRRPSFNQAATPDGASRLYEEFVAYAEQDVEHVATGRFGSMMDVALVNDGPFTIVLDTDEL